MTRPDRLAIQFQREIATILQQELKDPGLGFVTVTRVELSRDLRRAIVFFSCLGSAAEREHSQAVLGRSARYIYGLLKKRFRLKAIPQLTFRYDESIAGSIEISQMLDKIRETE